MQPKKVIIWTDFLLQKTGLARNGRELALYLYNTGKYEIVYYCCGMSVQHPEYSKFPFKVIGCLPNNPAEMEAVNRADEGLKRHLSYGNGYIEKLLQDEKPDVLIMLNDSWGFSDCFNKPWWDKFGCIPVITLDSIPFIPDQKAFIEKSKNFYVWTEFAEREAHRLGYKHVKTLTGMLNPKHFHKVSKARKLELRKNNNIPEDAFITGFVFRNQIRKEVRPLLEGFQIFRKENPEVKSYLLLFTHFSEGWDLVRLMDDLGVPKEFVLTCYICRNCRGYQIKSFTGQDQDCPHCRSEKAQITCNVGLGILEEELRDVYNMMDCYIHPMNCGGLEYPLCESLFCELPLATVPYSCGETFTDQPFVFKIDCTYTCQLGTQFVRAVPSSFSISKIMKKINELPEEKRAEIGAKGRKWALGKFSPEVVGRQYEEIIDALPVTNYDFKFSYQAKNPDFPFPEIENDDEFIKSLYQNILCCSPDPTGFDYWRNAIKNKMSRHQIYQFFVDIARKDNEKNGIGLKKLEDFLLKEDKKKLLLVAKESIGDCIYIKGLIDSYKESYPEYRIYIATDSINFEIFEDIPDVVTIPYHPVMESEVQMTGSWETKGIFDVYTHLTVLSQRHLSYISQKDNRLSLLKN